MVRRQNAAEAERDLVRVCHTTADPTVVQDRVLHHLRRLLTADAAFFATADPTTLLFTGARTEEPLTGSASLFLDNEFGGGDVNAFASLARAPVHVATLDDATRHDRHASARYRDIMRPLGLGDELRAALVVAGQCWGYLCLHRTESPRGFSTREVALLERVGPHIAHALRRAVALCRAEQDTVVNRPGVLLLADDLSVVASTPEAEQLVDLIGRNPSGFPLPAAVCSVAAALHAVQRGVPLDPSATVRARNGRWISLHAARLQGPAWQGTISVVLEPTDTRGTPSVLLGAYALTPRETEVATRVLRGESTRTITDGLHISAHTVQDHLKAIFDKTGARSRRELVGLVFAPR
ncbi:GAF domain-containing protein [Pseudonocardia sp. C8]|uniref:LuxR C-terminal-related transcriptional regulator n=1 Tax=Pseudonocardia sp. C8 TaxID=2762759 RepID=UPI0016430551|nr:LuxR C-terminal-related transcriptional regulator [Pseudonocardia sp. C8]MBC3194508.1 GAF domain-containing protein [Pseudonocardia sp. C8]